ncbi:hypothetical protein GCM10010294_55200 [Streptomyces griseoloalbus]|nr:hypothetical protein GCM10010294_55200 [Streptomyces griseoloalbus]
MRAGAARRVEVPDAADLPGLVPAADEVPSLDVGGGRRVSARRTFTFPALGTGQATRIQYVL